MREESFQKSLNKYSNFIKQIRIKQIRIKQVILKQKSKRFQLTVFWYTIWLQLCKNNEINIAYFFIIIYLLIPSWRISSESGFEQVFLC